MVPVPVIPTLRKWRQENQEFKVVLGYTFSSRPAWDIEIHRRPCLEQQPTSGLLESRKEWVIDWLAG